jgi:hypothetical protein
LFEIVDEYWVGNEGHEEGDVVLVGDVGGQQGENLKVYLLGLLGESCLGPEAFRNEGTIECEEGYAGRGVAGINPLKP